MEPDIMTRETEVVITVYSKTPCVQCTAVKRKLTQEKAIFTVVDVSLPENAGDLEAIKALGYDGVPVTMVNDDHFYGFEINKIADAVARQRRTAIHLVEESAVA